MARFGKYTNLIYMLLAVAVLEFIGLAGVLLWDSAARQAPAPEPDPPPVVQPVPQPEAPAPEDGDADSEDPDADPAWQPEELEPQLPEEKEPPEGELTAKEILDGAQIIAHGMGAVDGIITLNCLEGFQEQYAKGVRVFEVDLRMTADQQVVLRHDWRAGWQEGISETAVPTLEEFLDKPLKEQYTPLSFRDLLLLMEEYPDICVVTDTKFTDAEIVKLQFEAMIQDARELGLSYLFDRMAIQVYNPLMFRVVDSIHHFRWYIYTLYAEGFNQTEEMFREKATFCTQNGILGITMWNYWWRAEYADIAGLYGIKIYTHTVNDGEEARALLESGAAGVYTDDLTPAELDPEAEETDGTEADGTEADGAETDETNEAEEPTEGQDTQDGGSGPADEGGAEHGTDGEDTVQ